jgi:hypothetical protein
MSCTALYIYFVLDFVYINVTVPYYLTAVLVMCIFILEHHYVVNLHSLKNLVVL